MIENMKIAFLGTGFMASAMVSGLIKSNTVKPENIIVINPHNSESYFNLVNEYGVVAGEPESISGADVVVFAFKPQSFEEAMQVYTPFFNNKCTCLSIMAGIKCEAIEKYVKLPVIRSMPNLALSVSLSATAYCVGNFADEKTSVIAEEIFKPLGVVSKVEENLISTVTALSGSGPAYFYYLCEAMSAAAVKQGMDKSSADALAVQTLIGTAKLISDSKVSASEMRARITSKKGTTERAVDTFSDNGFFDVIEKGMNGAKIRSDELAELFG